MGGRRVGYGLWEGSGRFLDDVLNMGIGRRARWG